jgi:hypothetical protein
MKMWKSPVLANERLTDAIGSMVFCCTAHCRPGGRLAHIFPLAPVSGDCLQRWFSV